MRSIKAEVNGGMHSSIINVAQITPCMTNEEILIGYL